MIQQIQQFRTTTNVRKLLLVNGGNVVVGTFVNGTLSSPAIPTSGTSAVVATGKPELIESAGWVYILDGSHAILKSTATAVTTLSATTGTAPGNVTIGCLYRNRLVVSGLSTDPQNYFATRVGTHTDWDYSQKDPAAAFAGNNAKAGLVGDKINAVFSTTDDDLVFGADKSIWRMSGDIGYGGQITRVSGQTGMISNTSWTEDESGNIYFVGTNGFYIMPPGGLPLCLSSMVYDAYFARVNRTDYWVECEWDRERHGCWIFVTAKISGASTHLWYDARNGGFWPQQFPIDHGPICSHFYDGEQPGDRVMLMGSRSGYLWRIEDSALDDGGTLIASKLFIGPITPLGAGRETKLITLRSILGPKNALLSAGQFGVNCNIFTARDANTAAAGTPLQTISLGALSEKYNAPKALRVSGHTFFLELIGDTTTPKQWALDELAIDMLPAGRVR